MRVVETVAELREARAASAAPLGLVPTMGYLHDGHLSLVHRARAECRTVVVSVFVNPTQFGPMEDFARYPRDVPHDLGLCREAGVDLVFAPPVSEVYPPGDTTIAEVQGLQDRWEGASRPGHFRGVATVVAKLFGCVRPERAYFGEKDYQQLQIVHRLAADLLLGLEIVGCPTVREPDGLALSSRNVYLSEAGRKRATVLWRALQAAQQRLAAGERIGLVLCEAMQAFVHAERGVQLDYAAVVDSVTLEPMETVLSEARALIAASIEGVRLIDNASLVPPTP